MSAGDARWVAGHVSDACPPRRKISSDKTTLNWRKHRYGIRALIETGVEPGTRATCKIHITGREPQNRTRALLREAPPGKATRYVPYP